MKKLVLILDNIRSAFNVGSIFRTADATGCAQIYICGMTPTPDNSKLFKTALGATETVEWKYFSKTTDAVVHAKSLGFEIVGIELTDSAIHFQKSIYNNQTALVLGHERLGVNQLVLDMCDKVVMIPMNGSKESLNVATTAGIVMFEALRDNVIC